MLSHPSRSLQTIATALILSLPAPHVAQAAIQSPAEGYSLQLLAQRPWHKAGDTLALEVRVTNSSSEDLEGFRIQVAAHDRVTSRSDLHVSFEGSTGLDAALLTDDDNLDTNIPAGSSIDMTLNDPVADLLPVGVTVEGGVYPLSIRLYDATGFTLLDELTTHLLYYPSRPERPLSTVVVLALNDVPSKGPTGRFQLQDEAVPLEGAMTASGWLTGVVDSLLQFTEPVEKRKLVKEKRGRRGDRTPRRVRTVLLPPLELGLAPTPRLLEELADMADGYVRETGNGGTPVAASSEPARAAQEVLRNLRTVAERPSVQTLLVPYANPDLPAVTATGSDLLTHIALGEEVVGEVLTPQVDRSWLFPPAGRLDEATLEQLTLADAANRTFVDQSSLATALDPEVVQCPEASPTFACAVRLETGADAPVGFVIDRGVDERFAALARDANDRLELQNLLAETAMVHAELPGTLDRALHFVIPSTWHPSAGTWKLFLHTLARAPWLQTRRPDGALRAGLPVVHAQIGTRVPPVRGAPDEFYYEDLGDTATLIEHLESLGAPADLIEELHNNLLVAQSRVWWSDPDLIGRGTSFVTGTGGAIDERFDAIRVRGPEEITLTSRRGKIQLVVLNEGGFTADIIVELSSTGAQLDPARQELRVPEGTQSQLDIDAIAQTSGIFTMVAEIKTSDGYVIATKPIRVRSTKFNLIALGLTIGALLFLILFYATRRFRRDGKAGTDSEAVE